MKHDTIPLMWNHNFYIFFYLYYIPGSEDSLQDKMSLIFEGTKRKRRKM